MEKLQILVHNEQEGEEAQNLLVDIGYKKKIFFNNGFPRYVTTKFDSGSYVSTGRDVAVDTHKTITLPELRKLAGRESLNYQYAEIEKVRQSMQKEYLVKNGDSYDYVKADYLEGAIEVPQGAEIAIRFRNDQDEHGVIFYKNNGKSAWSEKDPQWDHDSDWNNADLLNENLMEDGIDLSHDVLWSRFTQPEELPFVDDEPKLEDIQLSLSPKATESRKSNDNVNNPSHYTQGGIECIDAIKAALTDEEFRGFCKANAIKYLWRTNHKNGLEDLKKARWYLNKLIDSMDAE